MTQEANVSTPSLTYTRLEALREPCRDLMAGLPKIREKAATYLPREPMELEVQGPSGIIDPWKNRVARARLRNAFADAVDSLAGRAFNKEPKFDEDTPAELVEFMDDVDNQGNNFQVFALDRFVTAVAEGLDFVLVDFPAVDENRPRSIADDQAAGVRSFWRAYSPASVRYWETENRNGQLRLLNVRLCEKVTEKDGEWGEKEIEQYRVFYAGNPDAAQGDPSRYTRWEIWRQNDKKEWFLFQQGQRRPQVDIPLVDVATDSTGFFEACPPLLDMAHLNIAHLRKASDLDNAQHAVGFPFLHLSGVTEESIKKQLSGGLGPQRFIYSTSDSGDCKFVEPQGSSWAAIEKSLETIEEQMAEQAGDPLQTNDAGNITATGEVRRSSKGGSKWVSWVVRAEDAFSALMYYTAQDMNLVKYGADSGWGGVELNKQFTPSGQNIEGARVVIDMKNAGDLSKETAFEVAKRAGLGIPEDLDWAEEKRRIELEGPSLSMAGRDSALARRVADLVAGGMDSEAALAQAEQESDGAPVAEPINEQN